MAFTGIEEGSGYCGRCLKQVPVVRVKVNHLTYLCLTLLTGIWLIFWVRECRKVHHWYCMNCGAEVYRIMQ